MEAQEIKKLIEQEVNNRLKEERVKLSDSIEAAFLYRGEFAKAFSLMQVFRQWAGR